MPNPINFEFDGFCYVVADELEIRMAIPVLNVHFPAGEVDVETDHLLIAAH